tara:strand:+ start:39164 stop:39412 length:249 start_codon:yes stop_codon:yes gene_type:complete
MIRMERGNLMNKFIVALFAVGMISACSPAEEEEVTIEDVVEDVEETTEEAIDEVEEAAEDAGEEMEETAEEIEEAVTEDESQ